jgi:hypothetical protein
MLSQSKIWVLWVLLWGGLTTITGWAQELDSDQPSYPSQKQAASPSKDDWNLNHGPNRLGAKFYPFAFVANNFMVGLEHAAGQKSSLNYNLSFGFGDNSLWHDVSDYSNVYFELQYRYYPIQQALYGVYFAPFVLAKNMWFTSEDQAWFGPGPSPPLEKTRFSVGAVHAGLIVGYQFNLKFFLIDMYMGGGPMTAFGDYERARDQSYVELNRGIDALKRGMALQIGLSFGVGLP